MKLLQDVLEEAVSKYSDAIAFDSFGRQMAFSEVFQRVEYLAGAFQSLGIRKGDRVAILAENSVEYIICHYVS